MTYISNRVEYVKLYSIRTMEFYYQPKKNVAK